MDQVLVVVRFQCGFSADSRCHLTSTPFLSTRSTHSPEKGQLQKMLLQIVAMMMIQIVAFLMAMMMMLVLIQSSHPDKDIWKSRLCTSRAK